MKMVLVKLSVRREPVVKARDASLQNASCCRLPDHFISCSNIVIPEKKSSQDLQYRFWRQYVMSSFEPWKAIKPSAPAPTGQDPLSEAFKNAVNAFGWPDRTGNYVDALPGTSTRRIPSAYLPSDSVERGYPVTSEQSRTAAIPTTNQPSSSNVTGAAHQQLPSLIQATAQDSEPQDVALHAQRSGSTVHPTTRQQRIVQQPASPSVISHNAGLDPPSKRRRVTGTRTGPSETPTIPPTP
jgi:hypothetical protein